ncbi:MAG: cytochrome c-type biogenesis protein CcmH [Chloroflexota bacterium]|nr:cytochrome c-type biogenesis protein CcmH [Chloroflexota bacterium]
MRIMRLLIVLAFLIAFTAMPAFAGGITDEVQANLMCQCGCTMVLATRECGTAEQMRTEIVAMIDKGQTKDDILNYYVGKYGEKVLAAPVAQGFNLSAYITPFAVILLGAGAIALIARQWVIRTRTALAQPVLATSTTIASPDELRARLDNELRAYE